MDKGKGKPEKIFSGQIVRAGSSEFYKFQYAGCRMPACYNRDHYPPELCRNGVEYAWGYEGNACSTLALDILMIYAGLHASHTHLGEWFEVQDVPYYNLPTRREPAMPLKFVYDHYKQFATDIIANLPDNWKLTFEEIDRWVEQQTKGKNNERESKTTGTENT